MASKIEYRDTSGLLITSEQAGYNENYTKNYFDDNVLIKEETFKDGTLKEGIYNIYDNRTYTDVLNILDKSASWEIRNNLQIINGYKVWEIKVYKNNILSDNYIKEVFIKGRLLSGRSFDSKSEPVSGTYKILYLDILFDNDSVVEDMPFNDVSLYSFYFDANGEISAISPDTEGWDRPYSRLSKFLTDDGVVDDLSPEQLHYFTNADPLIPDVGVFKMT